MPSSPKQRHFGHRRRSQDAIVPSAYKDCEKLFRPFLLLTSVPMAIASLFATILSRPLAL